MVSWNIVNKNVVIIVLLSALVISVFFNVSLLLQPSPLIGIVDHKKIGQGTDRAGQPVTWYTVSLWLVTEDEVNGYAVGETFAYIVDEEDYGQIEEGDVAKAIPLRDFKIDIVEIVRKTEPSISIVRSDGKCGDLEKPLLAFEREGENVILRYLESANVPCYRHVIDKSVILERWPPIIDITLKLESTSDVCVECIGTIETVLRVGPVPDGTEITVNGLSVTV
ncbi:MAG: hypothetical protein GTN80_09895 [Nitrososphaeria archaeon]|nr:hypothetical protein [Nitrososphaeria archaeon]NIN53419.1 hypothetical protein [Nitrososphaeria archaeon]NIQ33934.1 hypothetical protein [Nitrososphaeria archaeon]